MSRKIHLLGNRDGVAVPKCKTDATILDLMSIYLPMSASILEVTCKTCLKKHYKDRLYQI